MKCAKSRQPSERVRERRSHLHVKHKCKQLNFIRLSHSTDEREKKTHARELFGWAFFPDYLPKFLLCLYFVWEFENYGIETLFCQ